MITSCLSKILLKIAGFKSIFVSQGLKPCYKSVHPSCWWVNWGTWQTNLTFSGISDNIWAGHIVLHEPFPAWHASWAKGTVSPLETSPPLPEQQDHCCSQSGFWFVVWFSVSVISLEENVSEVSCFGRRGFFSLFAPHAHLHCWWHFVFIFKTAWWKECVLPTSVCSPM